VTKEKAYRQGYNLAFCGAMLEEGICGMENLSATMRGGGGCGGGGMELE